MNEYLFSYGTLQKETVQLELFGRHLTGSKDILEGYMLAPIEIKDESFLSKGDQKNQLTAIQSVGDIIEGIVFKISMKELLKSDDYEPENYERIKVALQSGKEAWIYLAT
jgi:Gamma-glutamyl cyclotransferase, AIG2-like